MKKKRLIIKNGYITGFADEVSFSDMHILKFSKTRVSHIIPANHFLMLFFKLIRFLFREQGILASWTRVWNCEWFVLIDGKKYGPFFDRKDAVQFEKNKIYEQGKLSIL